MPALHKMPCPSGHGTSLDYVTVLILKVFLSAWWPSVHICEDITVYVLLHLDTFRLFLPSILCVVYLSSLYVSPSRDTYLEPRDSIVLSLLVTSTVLDARSADILPLPPILDVLQLSLELFPYTFFFLHCLQLLRITIFIQIGVC